MQRQLRKLVNRKQKKKKPVNLFTSADGFETMIRGNYIMIGTIHIEKNSGRAWDSNQRSLDSGPVHR